MTVETDLYDALSEDSGVSSIVGEMIYPVVLPDTHDPSNPAIVYLFITDRSIGGNCRQTTMQVSCYAKSYSSLKSVRDAVVALIQSKSNWHHNQGPDLREEDSKLIHQPIDVKIS